MTIRLATQSVGEALVASLRDRILTEDIPAGVPVTEAAVAQSYSVARQTAKAAIERLVGEGLLERTTHRSARVPILDAAQVKDLYLSRGIIEARCYEVLAERAHISPEVEAAHASFLASATSGDLPRIVDEDVRFHRALVDSIGSLRLSRAHELIINEMRLCLAQVQSHHLLDPSQIAREHELIVTAIRSTSAQEAAQAGLDHLAHAESKLLVHLDSVAP